MFDTNPTTTATVAPLRNVRAFVELMDRVQTRDLGLPGMATFYGPSGYGKTTAATYASNKFRAHNVQVKSAWTSKKLCHAILTDLSIKPARTVADMVDQIGDQLGKSGRPLLIDEADHLISRGMIEIVRDIYESSGATVILIGEEMLPQKLQQWERVHGRMLDWVAAQPGDLSDVTHLANIWCRNIQLDDEFKAHLLRGSNASIRRISVNLSRVKEFAHTNGLTEITMRTWGNREFFTGLAPAPRKFSA